MKNIKNHIYFLLFITMSQAIVCSEKNNSRPSVLTKIETKISRARADSITKAITNRFTEESTTEIVKPSTINIIIKDGPLDGPLATTATAHCIQVIAEYQDNKKEYRHYEEIEDRLDRCLEDRSGKL